MSLGKALSPAQRSSTPSPAHTKPLAAQPSPPTSVPCVGARDKGLIIPSCLPWMPQSDSCLRLITDGLRLCQPMNKITVVLQCKYTALVCEVLILIGWLFLMRKFYYILKNISNDETRTPKDLYGAANK